MKKRRSWMIQSGLISRLIVFVSVCFLSHHSFGQDNLYDETNTAKFAKYLFSAKQYELALGEYQRLLDFDQQNTQYQIGLLSSFRHLEWYDSVQQVLPNLFADKLCNVSYEVAHEIALTTVLDQHVGDSFIRCATNLPKNERNNFLIIKSILSSEWEEAQHFTEAYTDYDSRLTPLAQHEFNFLKPGLAAFWSTIIPGSGKFYAKRGKDGFFSMVLISTFAFQSITAFNKRGVSSVYGWITGAMGAGYYFGNIYGSYKAAKQYNRQQEEIIQRDARKILYSMD